MKKYRIVQFEDGNYAAEELWFFGLFGTGAYLDLVEVHDRNPRTFHWSRGQHYFRYSISKDLNKVRESVYKVNGVTYPNFKIIEKI